MPAPRQPSGFAYQERSNGDVVITHHDRPAVVLRGTSAARFLAEIATADAQAIMARYTGQYQRGNERTARDHPRSAGS